MRVIMFQEKFADKVREGSKCQTIRKAARCKAGDTLSLRRWTGKPYRSKQEIIRKVVCDSADDVLMMAGGIWPNVWIGGKRLNAEETVAFAKADGFADPCEMSEWFCNTHGMPFRGVLIKWSDPGRQPPAARKEP